MLTRAEFLNRYLPSEAESHRLLAIDNAERAQLGLQPRAAQTVEVAAAAQRGPAAALGAEL